MNRNLKKKKAFLQDRSLLEGLPDTDKDTLFLLFLDLVLVSE